jgi:putative transposase
LQKSLNGQENLTQWRVKRWPNDALFAIQRFFSNCKAKKPGKKGYPQFKKHTRSVEYKTSGWKLSTDKRCLNFTDGFAAGTFKLLGSRDLHFI